MQYHTKKKSVEAQNYICHTTFCTLFGFFSHSKDMHRWMVNKRIWYAVFLPFGYNHETKVERHTCTQTYIHMYIYNQQMSWMPERGDFGSVRVVGFWCVPKLKLPLFDIRAISRIHDGAYQLCIHICACVYVCTSACCMHQTAI